MATPTTAGLVHGDGTTVVTDNGVAYAKDIAINGDAGDLASKRGQIGDYVSGGTFDFNNEIKDTKNIFYGATGSTNVPLSAGPFALQVKTRKRDEVEWGAYFVQTCGYAAKPQAATKASYTTDAGVTYTTSGWSKLLDDRHIGDGITVNNGIISVPEMRGATPPLPARPGWCRLRLRGSRVKL